jgi:hypothetical protein
MPDDLLTVLIGFPLALMQVAEHTSLMTESTNKCPVSSLRVGPVIRRHLYNLLTYPQRSYARPYLIIPISTRKSQMSI